MRIRTIKPEWLGDDRLIAADSDARVVSIALLLMADDYGRGRLGMETRVRVFPLDGLARFDNAFAKLEPWYARAYEVRGQRYFEVANWSKHQLVKNPSKPHVPGPEEADPTESLRRPCGESPETLTPDQDQDQDQDQDLKLPTEARQTSPDPVALVFEHWRKALHPKSKLTTDRRRKIKARLKEGYTVDQLKRAVDGCAKSEWHRERGHTAIGLIFRNAEKTDAFIQVEHTGAPRDGKKSDIEIDNELRAARQRLYEGKE